MKRILLLLLLLAALAAAKDSTRVIRIKLSSEGGLNTQRLMERDCQNYVLVDDSQKDQEYDYLLTVMHSERQGPYLWVVLDPLEAGAGHAGSTDTVAAAVANACRAMHIRRGER